MLHNVCQKKNTISIITTTTKIKKKESKISKQGKYLGKKRQVCVLSYKSNRNKIRPKKKYLMFFFVECVCKRESKRV